MNEQNTSMYSRTMDQLSPEAVYEGLIKGMFAENLPPIFTMDGFYETVTKWKNRPFVTAKHYVSYDSMRNIGVPRQMGIPEPFAYDQLCRYIKDIWSTLQTYFKQVTAGQTHLISQIHLQKLRDTPLVFKMNYPTRSVEASTVEDQLRRRALFIVKADISTCFPSIYTHALSWAATSKHQAKTNAKNKQLKSWGDQLDLLTRLLRDRETCGLLIGPHASNLLSEIILTRVDEAMWNHRAIDHFTYTRSIDDYTCYANSHKDAELFLALLKDELAKFHLSLNYKKVSIKEAPEGSHPEWLTELRAALLLLPSGKIGRDAISVCLDTIIGIMKRHKDGAVFSYAAKVLSEKFLSEPARMHYVQTMLHLAYCYPYLYRYLDTYVFYAFDVETDIIQSFAVDMIKHGLVIRNFEEVAYGFFFAIKYGFSLGNVDVAELEKTCDCISLTLAAQYFRNRNEMQNFRRLHDHAIELANHDESFDEFWPFVYETLDCRELKSEWAKLKKEQVSFLKNESALAPFQTADNESYLIVWTCQLNSQELQQNTALAKIYNAFIKECALSSGIAESALENAFRRIVGNLLVNSSMRRNVRIPRTISFYQRRIESEPDFPNREIDSRAVVQTLDWLLGRHFIGERKGTRTTGYSVFWPKEQLLEVFADYDYENIINTKPSETVIMKDNNKQPIRLSTKHPVFLKYSSVLEKVNDMLDRHVFKAQLYGRMKPDGFKPRLKAIFNDGQWTHGGRLYASATQAGCNYQCIPSDLRHTITIDGKPTVEVDYSGLHPHLLYAKTGNNLEGNAYDFLNDEDRSLAKFALLVMLNARTKTAAIEALNARRDQLRDKRGLSLKKEKLRAALLRNEDYEKVLDSAAKRHEAIRRFFYRGTGVHLQNLDSRMSLEILSRFLEKDVPVLPVFDSFIVERKHEKELKGVMDAVYQQYNKGQTCPITT